MIDIDKLDFSKAGGLIPAIITDKRNNNVLMLGFMNREAVEKTVETRLVTFFSRSRNTLWTKGETSGNYLNVIDITADCDNDTLLISALPEGNTCHTGTYSCFNGKQSGNLDFLNHLYGLIVRRKNEMPEGSYTTKLFQRGPNRIIQKVGEEAIETVIAAKNRDRNEVINEVSDLLYHLFVMLAEQEIEFTEVVNNLESRHK